MKNALVRDMKPHCSLIFLFLFSCTQAGTIQEESANSNTSTQSSGVITIDGYVGLGALSSGTVNLIDISDPTNPAILASATADAAGHFQFSESFSDISLIELVAGGGSYIDPFTYQTVSGNNYELKAIYQSSSLRNQPQVYLTPFSTLFVSLYDCLSGLGSLHADPYFYTASIFNDVFDVYLSTAHDLMLNPSGDFSDNDSLYTLYNLAFSKMSSRFNARSGIDLTQVFSEHITDACSLLMTDQPVSKSYTFSAESFRRDYLEAFADLEDDAQFADLVGTNDLADLVSAIRASNNLIFGFETYAY